MKPDQPVIAPATEDLLRHLAPQVLGALVRRYGNFDTAEDAVQEALVVATLRWPRDGVPSRPRAWLITVASRRLTDLLRREQARRRREEAVVARALPEQWLGPPSDSPDASDDTLILLFMCCHPSLSPASQIALTLRAVGGLTTLEVARAFLVPEATMTRRVSRAKRQIEESGVPFGMPPASEQADRLTAVLHVLYLIFNEGYVATSGPALQRSDLSAEAIRLTRIVSRFLPDDPEVVGLLALMLLTDARRAARCRADGSLVPMADQDRTLWDSTAIAEGVALISKVLPGGDAGPYQLQAAIAAIHDEAPSFYETDWAQIVALYEILMELSENPVVALNHAVAVAMVEGPRPAQKLVDAMGGDKRLQGDRRFHAVRGHLFEMAGDRVAARDAFLEAARLAISLPQQRYLYSRAAACGGNSSLR